uniref:transposase n=1 Tax=Streptomyces poriticola TaxID=3120506 RepID=UPI0038CD94A2
MAVGAAGEGRDRGGPAATRTTLTTLPGLGTVLAAKVLGHIGDVSRFPTEHHFAGLHRQRTPGRLQRQQRPPPPQHRWQPRR